MGSVSTYTNYSRGVSILVHKSLPFKLLTLELDPDVRLVILHAVIDRLELMGEGLYPPPPRRAPLDYSTS